ncbi:MAG: hypothetical protein KQI35_06395 [Bacteroidetes bacterium]|nr:hypothetical protein [Bacteroidota bacterium]
MKEIKLLEEQIAKLDVKGFDLNAWKQYTVVLLARIFGENDPKIKQVEKIEYDYSSWSLRDTSGSSAYMETCKKLGREILQASIDELKAFGAPDHQKPKNKVIDVEVVIHALEEELKVSQFKNLVAIINDESNQVEKAKALEQFLKNTDKQFPEKFLINLLSSKDLKDKF